MEAEFEMQPQDRAAFQRYWRRHLSWNSWASARQVLLWLAFVGQALPVWLVLKFYFGDDPTYLKASTILLGCLFLSWILTRVVLAINPNLTAKRMTGEWKHRRVTIDAEWLRVTTPISEESRRWRALEKIGVTRQYIFFFVQSNAAFLVPRRAFTDEEAYQAFVATARGYFAVAKSFRDEAYEETA